MPSCAPAPSPTRAGWWTGVVRCASPSRFMPCCRTGVAAVREPRAILFDLDDTLYPYRAFVRSGFRAVGKRLAEERGLPTRAVLKVLRRALVGGARGRELQALCERFSLPASIVPELADVIREHTPSLRLPKETVRVLS